MRSCLRWSLLVGALLGAVAHADPYDLRIYQLGNPAKDGFNYSAQANGNFRIMARQLAAAITSVNLGPPETLGHSGFAVGVELSVVDFGAQEVKLPTESTFQGPLLIPSLHIRKGLPFSLEIGARAGWIEKSRMGTATLELKWALNEGFTYLPDIGVRGNLTRLVNSRDFDITTGGIDIGVGKQFAIGGMVTLTPYVGWNLLFVGASTGNVDFRPDRSLQEADTPNAQFKDVTVFEPLFAAANTHNRFYGGLRFIGGVLQVGAEFSYSIIGKFNDSTSGTERSVPGVLAINSTIGLDF
ncbi:MAG: hypothetical protein K1X89_00030 [Myxococcaceae bacterium]|nr:hypothetical protein [Myxococcaceae bacterium]